MSFRIALNHEQDISFVEKVGQELKKKGEQMQRVIKYEKWFNNVNV